MDQRYLQQRMENLEELRARDHTANQERLAYVEQQLGDQTKGLREAITSNEALIRSAVGGEMGKGLDKAWWGLVLAGLGAAIQGVAAIWS